MKNTKAEGKRKAGGKEWIGMLTTIILTAVMLTPGKRALGDREEAKENFRYVSRKSKEICFHRIIK